jgi:hypothetical protein
MIEIIVDDNKYMLSEQTLKANPNFIISKIVLSNYKNDNPYIEQVDSKTFKIDICPKIFSNMIDSLRGVNEGNDKINYSKRMTELFFDNENLKEIQNVSIQQKAGSINNDAINNGAINNGAINNNSANSINARSIFQKPKSDNNNSSEFSVDSFLLSDNNYLTKFANFDNKNESELVNSEFSTEAFSIGTPSNLTRNTSQDFDFIANFEEVFSHTTPKKQHVYKSRKIELNTSEDDINNLNTKSFTYYKNGRKLYKS